MTFVSGYLLSAVLLKSPSLRVSYSALTQALPLTFWSHCKKHMKDHSRARTRARGATPYGNTVWLALSAFALYSYLCTVIGSLWTISSADISPHLCKILPISLLWLSKALLLFFLISPPRVTLRSYFLHLHIFHSALWDHLKITALFIARHHLSVPALFWFIGRLACKLGKPYQALNSLCVDV